MYIYVDLYYYMYTANAACTTNKCTTKNCTCTLHFPPSTLIAKCDSLEDPANGAVTVTGLYQGSTATYTCNVAYELVGDVMRTCNSSAHWTNVEPTCARKHLFFISVKELFVQCYV